MFTENLDNEQDLVDKSVEDSVINETDTEILNKADILVNKLKETKVDGVVLDSSSEIDSDNLEDTNDLKKDVENLDTSSENSEEKDDDNETITLTKKELRALKDSESDKKVAKVLERKQKEWNLEKDRILSEKQEEFEKYSKLSDSEKKQEELNNLLESVKLEKESFKTEKETFEAAKVEHETKVKQFNDDRLLENIKNDLILNELPENLAPILFKLEDAEKIKQALEELKQEFSVILQNKTAKYAQTKTPRVSNTSVNYKKKQTLSTSDMILKARQNNKK